MAEFGEQLRKARQAKGITQQTLAESIYVTRQTVSRWECGDRFPDLLTTKKVAQVLGTSVDQLLSDDDSCLIVERNPITENNRIRVLAVILYSIISVSFLISGFEIFIRIPDLVTADSISDLPVQILNLIHLTVGTIIFSLGLIWEAAGRLTPKRAGSIIILFWGTLFLINISSAVVNPTFLAFGLSLLDCIGAIAAYIIFFKKSTLSIWSGFIYIISLSGIVRAFVTMISSILFAYQYVSTYTIMLFISDCCIYFLFMYQVRVVNRKRKCCLHQ